MAKKKVKEVLVVGFEMMPAKDLMGKDFEILEVIMNTGDRIQIGRVTKVTDNFWQSLTIGPTPNRLVMHLSRMLAITSLLNRRY